MGAFALSAALFQRERTGRGQRIDLAMLDVALVMMAAHMTAQSRTGRAARPRGNDHEFATNSCYAAKEGLIMLGASNLRQQKRLWEALGRPEMVKRSNEDRVAQREAERIALADIMLTRTAQAWEDWLQPRHIPAARVRDMAEALADPHIATRGVRHPFADGDGVGVPYAVPVAPFGFAHGGPRVDTPPRALGADTDAVLAELGYDEAARAALRASRAI